MAHPQANGKVSVQPFHLVSLLDLLNMLPFAAGNLFFLAYQIDVFNAGLKTRSESDGVTSINTPEEREEFVGYLKKLRPICEQVQMKRTLERLNRYDQTSHIFESAELFYLLSEIHEITMAMDADLLEHSFLYMPLDEVKFYQQDDLWNLKSQFPEANKEIQAAGNCYATGNYTACVFHLMRCVEIGAKVMVSAMKAQKYITTPVVEKGKTIMKKKPVGLCDWKTLIDGLNKALDALRVGTKTSEKKKQTLVFYSHAISQFTYFKDAWRNNISHGHEIAPSRKFYLIDEATDIITNTKHFMRHLAKRLKESKGEYAEKSKTKDI